MVHPGIIEARLGELRFKVSRWFKPEINELQHVLMDEEKIIALACGRYFGSFALLVATDLRLLLIDKRAFFMTIDDTRYDMISEIDFNQQAYIANLTVHTISKVHKFSSMKHRRELRDLTSYVQRRVWEFRQQQPAGDGQPAAAQPPPPAAQVTVPNPTYQTVHTAQPQPSLSAQPTDYYVDDRPQFSHHWRERAEYVARSVGTAATSAAHHSPNIHPRPFHPYLSGSLMTHSPFNHSQQTDL